MTSEQEREFWLGQRSGLLKQVEMIEKTYLPEKWEERQAFKRWLEMQGRKRVAV